jgi:hypothetical protein
MMMSMSSGKDIKSTLNDELNEGEAHLTKKMREEKADFIKQFHKHQIKATDEEFSKALEGKEKIPTGGISVAKRQKRESDSEEELHQDKKKKKRFKKD